MSFHYEKDSDNIVTVTMDMDGPVNAMSEAFLPLLEETLERLEAEQELTGVVLTSGKTTFFAGGDLNMLCEVTEDTVADFFDGMCATKAAMRRLEKLHAPVCAAINGAAMSAWLFAGVAMTTPATDVSTHKSSRLAGWLSNSAAKAAAFSGLLSATQASASSDARLRARFRPHMPQPIKPIFVIKCRHS